MPISTRQTIIEKYNLEEGSDNELYDLVSGIANLFNVSVSTVSISLKDSVVFHTIYGFNQNSVSNENSFSTHVVRSKKRLIVEDLAKDTMFANNPAVLGEPFLRFFAGIPLTIENTTIGAFCIMDNKPRQLSEEQLDTLQSFSDFIAYHIQLVRNYKQLQAEHSLIDNSSAVLLSWRYKNELSLQSITHNTQDVLGIPYDELTLGNQPFADFLTPHSLNVFLAMLRGHIEGVEAQETQLELDNSQSERIWVNVLSKGFFTPEGRLQTIQAIASNNTEKRRIEHSLNEANKKMRLLLEASDLGTWDYDVKTQTAQVNPRWCEILGVDYNLFIEGQQLLGDLIHPDDIKEVAKKWHNHLNGYSKAYKATYRIKHGLGHWIWVETYGRTVAFDENMQPLRILGTHRDTTDSKLAEIHHKKQSQLLSFVNKAHTAYLKNHDLPDACQQILPEMVDIADSQFAFIGQLVIENDQRRLFLHAITEMQWDKVSEVLLQLYRDRRLYFDSFDNLFGEVIKTGDIVISNQINTHKASKGTPPGHPPIERFMGLPIKVNNKLIGMIGMANKEAPYTLEDAQFLQPLLDALGSLFYAVDLEKARADAENTLKQMAMTDALSELNNRRSFMEHCQCIDTFKNVIFAMIDIDHFKRVNDTYGHSTGDDIIKMLGQTMKGVIGPKHFLSRMGGEEFSVLLQDIDADSANELLLKLKDTIENTQITEDDHIIGVTISIGVAVYSHQDKHIDATLIQADKALYKAKKNGRNRVEWFCD